MSYATEALAITGKSLIITLAIGGSVVAGVGVLVPEWQGIVEGPSDNPDKGAACKRAKQLYLAVTGAEDSKAVRCVGSSIQDAKTGPEECSWQRQGVNNAFTGYRIKDQDMTLGGCGANIGQCDRAPENSDCDGLYVTTSTYDNLTDEQKAKYIEGH